MANNLFDKDMFKAGPGFTLPADIGDLDPAITKVDLSEWNLTGVYTRNSSILPTVLNEIKPQVCVWGLIVSYFRRFGALFQGRFPRVWASSPTSRDSTSVTTI